MEETAVQNLDQLDHIVRENSVFIKQIFFFFVTVSLFLVIGMMLVVLSRVQYQQKQVESIKKAIDPVKQATSYQGWTGSAGTIGNVQQSQLQRAGTRVMVVQ
uniref:ORF045 n=1 Tax=Spodoptera frugiperda granulovirus TaxID=307454 RepID=A0A346QVW4_9BBAC|nr:ORF045 [Spodoptera frugiperda granulovirus]